jgi:hypothetical protein
MDEAQAVKFLREHHRKKQASALLPCKYDHSDCSTHPSGPCHRETMAQLSGERIWVAR